MTPKAIYPTKQKQNLVKHSILVEKFYILQKYKHPAAMVARLRPTQG